VLCVGPHRWGGNHGGPACFSLTGVFAGGRKKYVSFLFLFLFFSFFNAKKSLLNG
jgi:hypothetical protein